MMPVFASAPLVPALLTCAAAWAIAVWALKQRDPITRLVQNITAAGQHEELASLRIQAKQTTHDEG